MHPCFLLAVLGLAALSTFAPAQAQTAAQVQSKLLEPPQISAGTLAKQMTALGRKVLIFDTRSKPEYLVSHLKGAIWVDSERSPDTFVAKLGVKAKGADIVFYCTMGARSAAYALQVMDALSHMGARRVSVLENGIIGWANAGLTLVDSKGVTKFVHTYDQETAKNLRKPELARFEPRR